MNLQMNMQTKMFSYSQDNLHQSHNQLVNNDVFEKVIFATKFINSLTSRLGKEKRLRVIHQAKNSSGRRFFANCKKSIFSIVKYD